ncbi:MAG: hypothetical protein LKF76_01185 [Eggerthellaceae bacterium]|nr:hypothetical protein [Eggerthellaceae bacterium]
MNRCISYTRRRAQLLLRCVAVCLVMVWAIASPTSSIAWAATKIVGDLSLDAPEHIDLACIDMIALPVNTDPDSIQTGVPCGMLEMCGQDPCLCGSVDSYGACACNGLQTTKPDIKAVSDDQSLVHIVQVFGKPYVLVTGTGSTTIHVDASLIHYNSASCDIQVQTAAFSPFDMAKILVALGVLAVAVFLAITLIRLVMHAFKKVTTSIVRHSRACGDTNKERLDRK